MGKIMVPPIDDSSAITSIPNEACERFSIISLLGRAIGGTKKSYTRIQLIP
jgi:hypothetical protein